MLRHKLIFLLGIVLIALCASLPFLGPHREKLHIFFVIHSAMFVVMLTAWWVMRGQSLNMPRFILLVAVLARLLAIPSEPSLSDDIYRYVWDGRLVLGLQSPYAQVPEQLTLQKAEWSDLYEELNSQRYHSVYPPFSQAIFALGSLLGQTLAQSPDLNLEGFCIRLLFAILDMLTVLGLARLIAFWKLPPAGLLLYAWNPLPIVEFAAVGHSDSGMLCCMVWCLVMLSNQRPGWSGILLAGAVLSKLLPVLAIPFWLRHAGGRGFLALALALLPAGIFCLFQPQQILNVGQSLLLYVHHFAFNSGLADWLAVYLRQYDVPFYSALAGRICKGLFLLGYLVFAARSLILYANGDNGKRGGTHSLAAAWLVLFTAYLVLSPTIHPWYIGWALVWISLIPSSAIVFAAAVLPFSYLFYQEPDPMLYRTWINVSWVVFFVLLACDVLRSQRQKFFRLYARRKARPLLPHIVGESILDLGAAEGWLAYAIAKATGKDVSLTDVVDLNETKQTLQLYDGQTLPYPDRTFDTTLLVLVLHHCEDPERVVQEAVRVTGRRLIVSESVYQSEGGRRLLSFLDRLVNGLRSGWKMSPAISLRTTEQWEKFFASVGLRLVHRQWLSRGLHQQILYVFDVPEGGRHGGSCFQNKALAYLKKPRTFEGQLESLMLITPTLFPISLRFRSHAVKFPSYPLDVLDQSGQLVFLAKENLKFFSENSVSINKSAAHNTELFYLNPIKSHKHWTSLAFQRTGEKDFFGSISRYKSLKLVKFQIAGETKQPRFIAEENPALRLKAAMKAFFEGGKDAVVGSHEVNEPLRFHSVDQTPAFDLRPIDTVGSFEIQLASREFSEIDLLTIILGSVAIGFWLEKDRS
ncbi:MAG: class I SAM-dependent methyltransferase [Verrucomicrobiales bacterium]